MTGISQELDVRRTKKELLHTDELALYIHVPFCIKRCAYCDFYSTKDTGIETVRAYVAATVTAISAAEEMFSDAKVPTIYFGGGTPAMLGLRILDVLDAVRGAFTVLPDAEITIEANPGSLDPEILEQWMNAGVTRISLGVQSFDKDTLRLLGRGHTVDDIMRAVSLLDDAGSTFSIDLMCGVPKTRDSQWRDQIEMAIACEPDHISIYPLTVEEGTAYAEKLEAGELILPESTEVADQMQQAKRMLQDAGYEHYEVANYAKPGKRSRHNVGYWKGRQYFGIGPSAASMLNHSDGSRFRGVAHETLDAFLENPIRMNYEQWSLVEHLDAKQVQREDLMLGMRMSDGVSIADVEMADLRDDFEKLVSHGLVTRNEQQDRYVPTESGWLLGNEIFATIWCSGQD